VAIGSIEGTFDGRKNRVSRRHFGLVGLLACGLLVYGAIVLTGPWAIHIGGRPTPLLYWTGNGDLSTNSGMYPLYITIWPSSHFSTLRLHGVRPTGGVQGSASLCTSPATVVRMELTGTIYGGWRDTDGSYMDLRLLETRTIDLGQHRGYFNLYGQWHGPDLVMNDGNEPGTPLNSGLIIQRAYVRFKWGTKSDFKAACATLKGPLR